MIIFIVGNSRSGTTMMSRILGNHKDIFSFQELHFFDEQLAGGNAELKLNHWDAIKKYAKLCSIQRNGYFGDHDPKPFIKEAENVLGNVSQHKALSVYRSFLINETSLHRKSIPCEQTPQNIFALEDILKLIPECKIIIMVRDPREVLLSQKNKWKRRKLSGGKIPFMESIRSKINYHPVTISKLWNAAVKQGQKFRYDKRVVELHYEKLLHDPEKSMRELCHHLEIEFSTGMLQIPVVGSSNKKDSEHQTGIDSNKTGQWNKGGLNDTEIAICEKINGNLMESSGYKLSSVKPNPVLLSWYYISIPFQLSLALLFNLRRFKNPKKIWKRIANS